MAKFITTTEISYLIEDAIKNADGYLIIVSPYLKVPKRLQTLFEEADKSPKVKLFFVCRELELSPSEKKWIDGLTSTEVIFQKTVHAKCILTWNSAIVSSLNLYEHSMVNNVEFGFVIDAHSDPENHSLIEKECFRLLGPMAETAKSFRSLARQIEALG